MLLSNRGLHTQILFCLGGIFLLIVFVFYLPFLPDYSVDSKERKVSFAIWALCFRGGVDIHVGEVPERPLYSFTPIYSTLGHVGTTAYFREDGNYLGTANWSDTSLDCSEGKSETWSHCCLLGKECPPLEASLCNQPLSLYEWLNSRIFGYVYE